MLRIVRIALFCALLAALVPAAASSATRMPIGFQDDPTFRWIDGAPEMLDRASEVGASIIRAQANWSTIAPTRPANARNSFDKAYNLNDLDDMIRNAQKRGMEVMLAIWGTPKWANGGKRPNVPPTQLRDLTNFAYALADRYSGRHPGYPYVGYWGVWNEPNLQIFLTPQFNAKGKIVSPAAYAKIYKAVYAGIKAANRNAKIAIGETSNQGRDHPGNGSIGDSVAPGTFARLLAQQRGLRFDAWAEHPYPTRPNLPPTQQVRWPNVTLTQIGHFGQMLNTWFKRYVPIWITEYGYETKPSEPAGVTLAQQASYMLKVLRQVKANPQVQMFIWFVFRDSRQSLWQSGVLNFSDGEKPAYRTFRALAPTIRGETMTVAPRRAPRVEVPVPRLASVTPPGQLVGINWKVFDGSKAIANGQAASPLAADGSISFVPNFLPAAGKTYTVDIDANDLSGNHAVWTYSLAASGGKTVAGVSPKKTTTPKKTTAPKKK